MASPNELYQQSQAAPQASGPNPTLNLAQNQAQEAARTPEQFQAESNYMLPGSGAEQMRSMGAAGPIPNAMGGDTAALNPSMHAALQARSARLYDNIPQNSINNINQMNPAVASQNQMHQQLAAAHTQGQIYALQTQQHLAQQDLALKQEQTRNSVINNLFNGLGKMGGMGAAQLGSSSTNTQPSSMNTSNTGGMAGADSSTWGGSVA